MAYHLESPSCPTNEGQRPTSVPTSSSCAIVGFAAAMSTSWSLVEVLGRRLLAVW